MQFPVSTSSFLNTICPAHGNGTIASVFSMNFIQHEIVVAHKALFDSDQKYLNRLNNQCKEVPTFVFQTLHALAPNDNARLPNFGRVAKKGSKGDGSNNQGGGGGVKKVATARLSKPKQGNIVIIFINILIS